MNGKVLSRKFSTQKSQVTSNTLYSTNKTFIVKLSFQRSENLLKGFLLMNDVHVFKWVVLHRCKLISTFMLLLQHF